MISKSLTRLRSKSEGSSSDYLLSCIKSKFPPLQFLAQRSKSARRNESAELPTINLQASSSYENLSNKTKQGFDNSQLNSYKKKCMPRQKQPISKKAPCLLNSENSPLNGNNENMTAALPIPATTYFFQNGNPSIGETASMSKKSQSCGQIQIGSQQSTSNLPPTHCVLIGNGSHIIHHSTPVSVQTKTGFPNGWNLCTPPHHSRHVPILAPDTPECDYGLSMRQRQLKYFSLSSKPNER